MQKHAIFPMQVRKIRSTIMPCESCNLKMSHYEATLDPPGRERVTHRLCENCIEGIKQY